MSERVAPKGIGIVAGSSLLSSDVFSSAVELRVRTEFGSVRMHVLESAACTLYMCQRHHASFEADYDLPHKINYPAIAAAFREQVLALLKATCAPNVHSGCDDDFRILFRGSVKHVLPSWRFYYSR